MRLGTPELLQKRAAVRGVLVSGSLHFNGLRTLLLFLRQL
jgi:hypothetical protein